MQSKALRTVFVIIILVMCAYVLYPSVYWYFILSKSEQQKYNKSASELASLKKEYQEYISKMQKLVPRDKQRLKKDGDIIFNLRPFLHRGEDYIFSSDSLLLERIFKGGDREADVLEFVRLVEAAYEISDEIEKSIELKNMRKNIIKLGLDLAGGTHLSISVDKKDLIKKLRKNYEVYGLKDENSIIEELDNQSVVDMDKLSVSELVLSKELKEELEDVKDGEERKQFLEKRSEEIKEEYARSLEEELTASTSNAIEIIRNRIDKFGVSEPKLSKGLGDTIFVELPQLDKRKVEDTIKTITEAGVLSFHIVDEDIMERLPRKYFVHSGPNRGLVDSRFINSGNDNDLHNFIEEVKIDLSSVGINLSDEVSGSGLYPQEESDEFGNLSISGFYILKNKVEVEGRFLNTAREEYDSRTGKPEVAFEFRGEGVDQFAKVTRENTQKRLAIVLDGKVKSAPVIQSEIRGRGRITLGKNPQIDEVKQLVAILKAGVLPARLNVESAITIGAKLGEESIGVGLMAVGIGMLVVIVFMILYYKLAGIIAVFALMLNLYLLLSVLSAFGFTLTLPGIAGIILTIGMAVDANVIIFERMREEKRQGKSRHSIISSAYEKAFSAIFDANLTTVLAAFILSQIGSGIIKGFGVTLMTGIVWSMFTALFVTRLIFDYLTDVFRLKKVYV